MNALSREVLQKVLTGFIITKPYVRRSGVRKEDADAPERRGFWDEADLCLGATEQANA